MEEENSRHIVQAMLVLHCLSDRDVKYMDLCMA